MTKLLQLSGVPAWSEFWYWVMLLESQALTPRPFKSLLHWV